jgi:2-polyprenyl-3-methyl-5-hydroxy-6-metoxy-1,4-benzoquinol methylase
LQQNGYANAEGIDISPEVVDVAQRLGVRNVRCADLREYLRERVGRYDLVVLRDVMEHFERTEIVHALQLVHGALRPQGAAILQVPNAQSPFFGRIRYGDLTHELAFTESSLAQLFNLIGFASYAFEPVPPPWRGLRALPRRVAWALTSGLYRMALYAELGVAPRTVTLNIIAIARKRA